MSEKQLIDLDETDLLEEANVSQKQLNSNQELESVINSQNEAKKKTALHKKLAMLQKEEGALQTLLVRLRNQQSALTVEKIRLNEAHKKITGSEQLNDYNFDEDDVEDEDDEDDDNDNLYDDDDDDGVDNYNKNKNLESNNSKENNYEITDSSINAFLEAEISEYN